MILDYTVNLFEEKSYLVGWGESCVVVDPGFQRPGELDTFFRSLEERQLRLEAILLTHAHPDHIFGVTAILKRFPDTPVYMHPADKAILENSKQLFGRINLPLADVNFPTTDISDGQILELAEHRIKVIATPGHSPGSVCYLIEDEATIFSGDTLFAGAIGRSDLLYGDYDSEIRSIMEKLILLDPQITILPGHGPSTSIGRERDTNPFLEPFNEPETPFDPEAEPIIIHS